MELKGIATSSSKAKGKIRIVINIDDFANVQKGEVLVTNLRPDNLMAVKFASAIITEEGGITSHLAKAAREFKTPCIVNVKNATQILKNGEFVEVDGDKGIIKTVE